MLHFKDHGQRWWETFAGSAVLQSCPFDERNVREFCSLLLPGLPGSGISKGKRGKRTGWQQLALGRCAELHVSPAASPGFQMAARA